MATSKKNIQLTLESIEIPSCCGAGNHRHLMMMNLVWPRLGVAKKSSTLTVPLVSGKCYTDAWSWTNKICFKESVEGTFGLYVSVSEPITETKIRNFLRMLAGKSAAVASDAIEDAVPIPVVDELAGIPMMCLSKQLLDTNDPDLIVEGCLDLEAAELTDAPTLITVPLIACRNTTAGGKRIEKKDLDGTAVFSAVVI